MPHRLRQHHEGTASSHTADRRPVTVVFTEKHPTWREALRRERQLRRWTRRKKEALIAGNLELLSESDGPS